MDYCYTCGQSYSTHDSGYCDAVKLQRQTQIDLFRRRINSGLELKRIHQEAAQRLIDEILDD